MNFSKFCKKKGEQSGTRNENPLAQIRVIRSNNPFQQPIFRVLRFRTIDIDVNFGIEVINSHRRNPDKRDY